MASIMLTAREAKANADSVSSRNNSILNSMYVLIDSESKIGKYQTRITIEEDSTYVNLTYIQNSLISNGYNVTIMYDQDYTPPVANLNMFKATIVADWSNAV